MSRSSSFKAIALLVAVALVFWGTNAWPEPSLADHARALRDQALPRLRSNIIFGIVRDFDLTPVANAGVFYFGSGSNIGSTLTDARGMYTLTVSADTYRVSVSKPGYPPPSEQMVTVPPDRTDVNFTFPQRYTIGGTIRDYNHTPLANALVAYFGSGPNIGSTLTGAAGIYTPGVPLPRAGGI